MNCRETKRILSQDKIHGNNPVQFLSFVLFLWIYVSYSKLLLMNQ